MLNPLGKFIFVFNIKRSNFLSNLVSFCRFRREDFRTSKDNPVIRRDTQVGITRFNRRMDDRFMIEMANISY